MAWSALSQYIRTTSWMKLAIFFQPNRIQWKIGPVPAIAPRKVERISQIQKLIENSTQLGAYKTNSMFSRPRYRGPWSRISQWWHREFPTDIFLFNHDQGWVTLSINLFNPVCASRTSRCVCFQPYVFNRRFHG